MKEADERALLAVQKLMKDDAASKMLGMEVIEVRYDYCQMAMKVRADMSNGYKICHGGFVYALADTTVAFACATEDKIAVSASSEIEFLASAKLGDKLYAIADVIHHKGRNCFCNITVKNQHDDLIALVHGRQVVLDADHDLDL